MIKYVSDSYILQKETSCDGEISTSGELVVKSQYLSCNKATKKFYWELTHQQQVISVSKLTIVHPYVEIFVVKDAQYLQVLLLI